MPIHVQTTVTINLPPLDNRQKLLKDIDKLTNMELTRESLLEKASEEVHSTTPVKRKEPEKKAAKKVKKVQLDAKLSAATSRVKEMMKSPAYEQCEKSAESVKAAETIKLLKEQLELYKTNSGEQCSYEITKIKRDVGIV